MISVDIDTDNTEGERCKMLVASVIQQAIHDVYYLRGGYETGKKTELVRGEAREWLFAGIDPNGEQPFSFEWCCRMLDRDPIKCRKAIKKRMFMKRWV